MAPARAGAGDLIHSNDARTQAARSIRYSFRAIPRYDRAAHICAVDDISTAPRPHTHLERNMNIRAPTLNAKSFTCVVALAACSLLSGSIQAKERIVTLKVSVNTAGLDVGQPAGARQLYSRLQHAANVVCGNGGRVGLETVGDFAGCVETAIGEAVRSANLPQLTMAYLRTHTLQQATTHGIEVPVLMAAK